MGRRAWLPVLDLTDQGLPVPRYCDRMAADADRHRHGNRGGGGCMVAEKAAMKRLLSRWLGRAPWLLAAVLLGVLVLRVPAFQRVEYWKELSHSYFPMATLALVLTPIILTGGIDLSVGSIAVLSGAA